MNKFSFWLGGVALVMLTTTCRVNGQVNGNGTSDSSLFDTVINIPGDPTYGNSLPQFFSLGGVSGQTAQLNVSNGATIDQGFTAFSGGEVNVSGGEIDERFWARSGSEVNVSGGIIGRDFRALSGSFVNLSGGSFDGFSATDGSGSTRVDISGGTFHDISIWRVDTKISGGLFNEGVTIRDTLFTGAVGGRVELIGGEFRLNGVLYTGGDITLGSLGSPPLSTDNVFSGTLADGSVFVFNDNLDDFLSTVTLTTVALPTLDTSPLVINSANPTGPRGIRSGQNLTLKDGGTLTDYFKSVGSVLNIEGGTLGNGVGAVDSEVNINGGSVGENFRAHAGSVINIDGGAVGNDFQAMAGSEVNISGGTIAGRLIANFESEVNISGGDMTNVSTREGSTVFMTGGNVTGLFAAGSDSEVDISGGHFSDTFVSQNAHVNISGGSFGDTFAAGQQTIIVSDGQLNISGGSFGNAFQVSSGDVNINGGNFGRDFEGIGTVTSSDTYPADLELLGGEFRLNGIAYTDTEVTLAEGDIFSGTLADGSTFIFHNYDTSLRFDLKDELLETKLTAAVIPTLDTAPIFVNTVNPDRPSGLRAGQELTLLSGGELGRNFEAVVSILNVDGGTLGNFAAVVGSEVNISGGNVGDHFDALTGSVVNISGGTIGTDFEVFSSMGTMTGGSLGDNLVVTMGSEMTISGGSVGDNARVYGNSLVNISGGIFGRDFTAYENSMINISDGIFGREFTAHEDSVINITGGTFGDEFDAQPGSEIKIDGGTFADNFKSQIGSSVTINDGFFGDGFIADGIVNINGGNFGNDFLAGSRSVTIINGGEIGDNFVAVGGDSSSSRSFVAIRGGSIGEAFTAEENSRVLLFGFEFFLDGVEITGLALDDFFLLDDRDALLSGTLADGSYFEFELNSTAGNGDFFDPDANLFLVRVVPEPTTLALLAFGLAAGSMSRRRRISVG